MDFQDILHKIQHAFPIESKYYNLNEESVLGIYCREVQKVETSASSSSNIQENVSLVDEFFPILENSEKFPHTRLRVDAVAPQSSIERRSTPINNEINEISGNINYRRKIQNQSPYIQLTFGGDLSQLKRKMNAGDEIIFVRLKKSQSYKYLVLLSSQKILSEHKKVWLNDSLFAKDRIKPFIDLDFIDSMKTNAISDSLYNKIYFGAPGTGKSHQIRQDREDYGIKNENVEVVTFHPEYDYFSFIGGYKPNTENGRISYSFVDQVFIKIYKRAWKAIDDNNSDEYFLLIIEEINRGNCAEIFGDIFQLLDRNPNYAISASKELAEHLEDELGTGHPAIVDRKLRLPQNLLIWATMNTSDQSLFPLDSAFKRRWTWQYIPINYDEDVTKNPSASFKINLNEKESFRWLEFIKIVNEKIKSTPHLGEDKCLGNYFINPKNCEMDIEDFVNKVLFYIWCDVFRDEESAFYEGGNFYELFYGEKTKEQSVRELLKYLTVNINQE